MSRKLLFSALLCLVFSPLAWCQSNVSLTRLIETNLVQNTALIYLIVPGLLNGQPGQGEYYLVFYMGVASSSPGVPSPKEGDAPPHIPPCPDILPYRDILVYSDKPPYSDAPSLPDVLPYPSNTSNTSDSSIAAPLPPLTSQKYLHNFFHSSQQMKQM